MIIGVREIFTFYRNPVKSWKAQQNLKSRQPHTKEHTIIHMNYIDMTAA